MRATRYRNGNVLTQPVTYIDSAKGLARLEWSLASADSAVDGEAAGYHRYSDRLCLLQLSTPSETFVIDQ